MKKQITICLTLLIICGLAYITNTSYSLIQKTVLGLNTYEITTGVFSLQVSNNNILELKNEKPVYDDIGIQNENELTFDITNIGNYNARYSIKLETEEKTIDLNYIRYCIDYGYGYDVENTNSLGNNNYLVQNILLKQNEINSYKVKVWLDIDTTEEYMNKTITLKLKIDSTQEYSKYAVDVIEELYNLNQDNIYLDNDTYYFNGEVDNNYVTFNNELWQIVGIEENNYENSNISYQVLKLIKEESAFKMAYDNIKPSFITSNIYDYLNNDYYNQIEEKSKNMILKAKYNVGTSSINSGIVTNKIDEASSSTYSYVGLLNLTDYQRSLNNGTWIKKDTMFLNNSDLEGTNVNVLKNNELQEIDLNTKFSVRPVVYLRPDVSIVEGIGTIDNPYTLEIKYPMNLTNNIELKLSE